MLAERSFRSADLLNPEHHIDRQLPSSGEILAKAVSDPHSTSTVLPLSSAEAVTRAVEGRYYRSHRFGSSADGDTQANEDLPQEDSGRLRRLQYADGRGLAPTVGRALLPRRLLVRVGEALGRYLPVHRGRIPERAGSPRGATESKKSSQGVRIPSCKASPGPGRCGDRLSSSPTSDHAEVLNPIHHSPSILTPSGGDKWSVTSCHE